MRDYRELYKEGNYALVMLVPVLELVSPSVNFFNEDKKPPKLLSLKPLFVFSVHSVVVSRPAKWQNYETS